MKPKDILASLPLLASILGRKYGVQVRIGGDTACTNGDTIYLPSLPTDCDETLLRLARGYCDHESAHIRKTDFTTLSTANLTSLEKHIWNTLEDWRVENRLAAIFPGCRQNFQWLIRHLFLPETDDLFPPQTMNNPAMLILEWLLITVRSWDVPELATERKRLAAAAEGFFPGLVADLELILQTVTLRCHDTASTITVARELVAVIKKYVHFQPQPEQESQTSDQNGAVTNHGSPPENDSNRQSLRKLLRAKASDLPDDLGTSLEGLLSGACSEGGERIHVAVPTRKQTWPLPDCEVKDTRQATTALRTRLQGMLQSVRAVRGRSGYFGVLNTHALHTLASGNTKLFLHKGERVAVNTAVHILLDCSGSMVGVRMQLAGQACFAVASALHGIKGISLGVTAFPGNPIREPIGTSPQSSNPSKDSTGRIQRSTRLPSPSSPGWQTVAPILKHNDKLHNRFGMSAAGGTPMDAAIWWVLQQLQTMPEPRKIILLITDGEPDFPTQTHTAIKTATALGYETYGIGIATESINKLLPGKNSRNIRDINDLAPAMFGILQGALIGRTSK